MLKAFIPSTHASFFQGCCCQSRTKTRRRRGRYLLSEEYQELERTEDVLMTSSSTWWFCCRRRGLLPWQRCKTDERKRRQTGLRLQGETEGQTPQICHIHNAPQADFHFCLNSFYTSVSLLPEATDRPRSLWETLEAQKGSEMDGDRSQTRTEINRQAVSAAPTEKQTFSVSVSRSSSTHQPLNVQRYVE